LVSVGAPGHARRGMAWRKASESAFVEVFEHPYVKTFLSNYNQHTAKTCIEQTQQGSAPCHCSLVLSPNLSFVSAFSGRLRVVSGRQQAGGAPARALVHRTRHGLRGGGRVPGPLHQPLQKPKLRSSVSRYEGDVGCGTSAANVLLATGHQGDRTGHHFCCGVAVGDDGVWVARE
jgi:hypothetical protein